MAEWFKVPFSMKVSLGPGNIVLDGDPAPPAQKKERGTSAPPLFGPCIVAAGWIKMPLGMEVSFGPGHIVLDGDPAPPAQKGTDPQFSAHVCRYQMAG